MDAGHREGRGRIDVANLRVRPGARHQLDEHHAFGTEVFRVEAYVRPFHFASALDYVASGAYRKEPSFQRYLQARAASIASGTSEILRGIIAMQVLGLPRSR